MSRSSIAILAGIAGLVLGIILAPVLLRHKSQRAEVVIRTDTLTVRDTVIERYPAFLTVTKLDTLLVAVRDTVMVHDTSYIVIEREQKHYKGDDYEAWVSGYRPALDSIRVFPETKYVTKTVQDMRNTKRWGIGLQAGCGVGVSSGQIRAFPYIGVGVSYNFIRF